MCRWVGVSTVMILGLGVAFVPSARAHPPSLEEATITRPVLAQLHLLDTLVIQAAELARDRTRDPDVRAYANVLRRDHRFADREVVALGDRLHIDVYEAATEIVPKAAAGATNARASGNARYPSPPLVLDLVQLHDQMARLRQLHGPAFDRTFVRLMVNVHAAAVTELSNAEAGTSVGPLVQLLSDVVPILRQHVALARALEQGVG